MKKENFVQIPIWLLDELKTSTEIKLFGKMYNGWCLMQDTDGWYYRAYSKLKEDIQSEGKCNRAIINAIRHFEELGILIVERVGKKTNRFKFDEVVLFKHIEEVEDNDRCSLKDTSDVACRLQENEKRCSLKDTIYNTKENILKENNMEPSYKNEEVQETELFNSLNNDIDLIEVMNQEPNVEEWEREQNEYLQWIEENKKECNSSSGVKSQSQLNNDYVSRVFKWLDDELEYYYQTKAKIASDAQNTKICTFIEKILDHRDRFTDKQWDVVRTKVERWQGISASKDKFYSRLNNEITSIDETEQSAASNEQSISIDFVKNNLGGARQHPQELTNEDILSAMEINYSGGCAAPQYNEEEYQQAVVDVCDGWTMGKLCSEGMETTIMKFQTIVENKLGCGVAWDKFRGDIIAAVS